MRIFKPLEVDFKLIVEQDDLPVRGNAISSGDDEFDRKTEQEIIDRADSGDVWAWAQVSIRASWAGFRGDDYLGGCSYKNEAAFTSTEEGGYFHDMVKSSIEDLIKNITAAGWTVTGADSYAIDIAVELGKEIIRARA